MLYFPHFALFVKKIFRYSQKTRQFSSKRPRYAGKDSTKSDRHPLTAEAAPKPLVPSNLHKSLPTNSLQEASFSKSLPNQLTPNTCMDPKSAWTEIGAEIGERDPRIAFFGQEDMSFFDNLHEFPGAFLCIRRSTLLTQRKMKPNMIVLVWPIV
jgi:hypothetical protein